MSTVIENGGGAGGREVIILGEGESLDEVAMAAGGGARVGEMQYVSLSDFNPDSLRLPDGDNAGDSVFEFSTDLAAAGGGGTQLYPSDVDSPGGTAGGGIEDEETALRAAREAEARARHAQVNGGEGEQTAVEDARVGERVSQVVMPEGRLNRRVVLIVLVALAAVFIFAFGGASKGKKKSDAAAAGQEAAEETPEGEQSGRDSRMRVQSAGDDTLRTPEQVSGDTNGLNNLRGGGGSLNAGGGGNTGEEQLQNTLLGGRSQNNNTSPVLTADGARAAAGLNRPAADASRPQSSANGGGESAQAARVEVAWQGRGGSAVRPPDAPRDNGRDREPAAREAMREGARGDEKQSQQPRPGIRLPAGTRIPMVLLEPLQTGIATTAEARVLADVKDVRGVVVLQRGSTVSIPFLAGHSNGRMMNDAGEEMELRTPNGETLILAGSVKGPDGIVGIKGVLKKSGGGNPIGRVVKGTGRAAARVAGGVVSRVDPSGVSREVGDAVGLDGAVAGRYGRNNEAQREVVNINAGVTFTFVVGK